MSAQRRFYCSNCEETFTIQFRDEAPMLFDCCECGEECGEDDEEQYAQLDDEGRFRCTRDDSPSLENCDDYGTGEGRWHGRM